VAAVLTAATVLVHAVSDSAPSLPRVSPIALATRIGAVDRVRFSGTVKLTVDIGLPRLPKIGTDGGADPLRLLSGEHRLRVATDTTGGAQRQRVALMDTMTEYDAVRDGTDLWLWDSTRQLARHGSVNALTSALLAFATPGELVRTFTGPAAIETAIFDTSLASRQTTRVAGRDAYVLQIKPDQDGATIGEISVAVDAATGMPLSVAISPTGSSKPAIKAEFTDLTYEAADSEFHFTPPPGATVVEEHAPQITEKPYQGTGKGWTAAACLAGFDPQKAIEGLGTPASTGAKTEPSGTAAVLAALSGTPGTPLQSYLRMMMAAGEKSPVGLVWSSRLVSVVFTPDQRLCVAFSTPAALVATLQGAPHA
jgi:outer membrane lipoprotein-sorting protein